MQAARSIAAHGCYEKGSGQIFCLPVAHLDHDFDLVEADTLWKLRKFLELDLVAWNIDELARIDIVEMVMRLGVRVVEASLRIHKALAHERPVAKQVQRVVDRRFGDATPTFA